MKKITTKKMALTAMLACLAFVLNTFVYFPAMAPFQHFVDVLAAVLVGPWYGFAASLLCGIMRMMSGRTKMFYGLDAQAPFYYIPFYTPSAIVGAAMGVVVVLILKKTGVLNRMQNELS